MKLTYEQSKKLHKEMWNWLSKYGTGDKHDWERCEEFEDILEDYNDCFACVIAGVKSGQATEESCKKCPIKWPNRTPCWHQDYNDQDLDGLFEQWCNNPTRQARKIAKQIANLPWKKRKPRRK
jgi:hypothetical protein